MKPLQLNAGVLTCIPFDRRVFDISTVWLANPDLRQLIQADDMPLQQRLDWFDALAHRDDYIIRAMALDNTPVGCFGIKHVDRLNHRAEYWSYLGNRIHWGLGIGRAMLAQGCLIACENDVAILYVHIASHNERSQRFFRQAGFQHWRDVPGGVAMDATVVSLLDHLDNESGHHPT